MGNENILQYGPKPHLVPTMPTKVGSTEDFLLARSEAMKKQGYNRYDMDRASNYPHDFHHLILSSIFFPFDHHFFSEGLSGYLDTGIGIDPEIWQSLTSKAMTLIAFRSIRQKKVNPEFFHKYVRTNTFTQPEREQILEYYAHESNPVDMLQLLDNQEDPNQPAIFSLLRRLGEEVKKTIEVVSFSYEEILAAKKAIPIITSFLDNLTDPPRERITNKDSYWNKIKKMDFSNIITGLEESLKNSMSSPEDKEALQALRDKKQRVFEYFYT